MISSSSWDGFEDHDIWIVMKFLIVDGRASRVEAANADEPASGLHGCTVQQPAAATAVQPILEVHEAGVPGPGGIQDIVILVKLSAQYLVPVIRQVGVSKAEPVEGCKMADAMGYGPDSWLGRRPWAAKISGRI